MAVPDPKTPERARIRGVDRGFFLLVLGAVVLILVGLISVPLLARRPPTLAPANTPEGSVQRFYQAIYQADYQVAYDLLSPDSRRQLSLAAFQQQATGELKSSQMVVSNTIVHDPTATVTVNVTYVRPGGLFGTGQSTSTVEVLLRHEGNDWKIVSGPFYLPNNP